MLVSIKWLNQYVKVDDLDPKDLADRITRSGIEVEAVYKMSEATNCVIGYVKEKVKHPDSDHLNVCQVELGEGLVQQIVCGAANVAMGQKVIVSKVGATLPGGLKIKKAKLRGVESNGMICSLKELGIENKFVPEAYQNGIYVLDADAPVGEDAIHYLGFDDTVLELSPTPNRSDALSMLGVAYEVAAILDRSVRLPEGDDPFYKEDANFSVKVDTPNCEVYYAKTVRNVKIGPSPLWMQQALIASNVRPINNVVDITNYVMLELGQPLHAFDASKLGSKEILVRQADDGETITTLDGIKRHLVKEDVVITNGSNPVALAGVMGGANSSIDDRTTEVILESAVFDPQSVRKTYTRLNLRSESSLRFEKQVDPSRTRYALNRAALLMEVLCGGEIDNKLSVCDHTKTKEHDINLSLEKINGVLGLNLTMAEVADIFRRLQFSFTVKGHTFHVIAPSRRQDLTIEEDLIEEVIRLYGFDQLPLTLPVTTNVGRLTPVQHKRRLIKEVLLASGLNEVLTYSLLGEEGLNRFKVKQSDTFEPVVLKLPMSEDRKYLRHSLIHHHLEVIAHNSARQLTDVGIFELARRYEMTSHGPKEEELLSGAITGTVLETPWQKKCEAVDFFYVKGIVEAVLERLHVESQVEFVQADEALGTDFHGGRTAYIVMDGTTVGLIGQIHPNVQADYDIEETYVFEINLDELMKLAKVEPTVYQTISRYPNMSRDIAIVVSKDVVASDILNAVKKNGGQHLKSVEIFDVYEGEHVAEGSRSIALSLTFENVERTLTEEEVTKAYQNVIRHLEESFNASLRQ